MGIEQDRYRFQQVGEQRRMDLADFVVKGDMADQVPEETMSVPIKNIRLPEFQYSQLDQGGIGQGGGNEEMPADGEPAGPPQEVPGEPANKDDSEESEEPGAPGDEPGDNEYYDISPEEFAEELDEAYGLNMEPKGKQVAEEIEGPMKERAPQGPRSTLDKEALFKQGVKRKIATYFDEEYVKEAIRVAGADIADVHEWLRGQKGVNAWQFIQEQKQIMDANEADLERYESFEELDEEQEYTPVERFMASGVDGLPFSEDDMEYKYPEIQEEYEKNAVLFNLRDVSGSMGEQKRELVKRTLITLDYYLRGKYDNIEFEYIPHNAEAWREADPHEFFGMQSSGGTRISSAYELVTEIQQEKYPAEEWNIFVFGAGDGENSSTDTEENVIPLMNEIPANRHSYIVTQPAGGSSYASHGEELIEAEQGGRFKYDVNVSYVNSEEDIPEAIRDTLQEAG